MVLQESMYQKSFAFHSGLHESPSAQCTWWLCVETTGRCCFYPNRGAHPASSVYFKVASFQFFLLYRGSRTSGIFHKVIILDVAGVAASRYQGVIFQIHYATSWLYHDWIISWCLEVFSVSLWRADTGEPNMIGTWVKSMKATGERLSSFTDEAPVIGFRCGSFSNNLQGKNSTFHRKTVR